MFAWITRLLRRPKPVMRVLFPYPAQRGDKHIPVKAPTEAAALRYLRDKYSLRLKPALIIEPARELSGYRDPTGRFYVLRPLPSQQEVFNAVKELDLRDLLSLPPRCATCMLACTADCRHRSSNQGA